MMMMMMMMTLFPLWPKLENIRFGLKICVWEAMPKTYFASEQQNLFPQHMFHEQLNWETFASTTIMFLQQCFRSNVSAAMFPSLARPILVHRDRTPSKK